MLKHRIQLVRSFFFFVFFLKQVKIDYNAVIIWHETFLTSQKRQYLLLYNLDESYQKFIK